MQNLLERQALDVSGKEKRQRQRNKNQRGNYTKGTTQISFNTNQSPPGHHFETLRGGKSPSERSHKHLHENSFIILRRKSNLERK